MTCKTVLVERNGVAISVTQWDATTGSEKLQSILEVFGDRVLPLILGEATFADFIGIVSSCKGCVPVMREINTTATVAVEGEEVTPKNYDDVIGTNYQLLFDMFGAVLEVNYKTFFEQGLITMPPEKQENQANSSTTSETP